MGTTPIPPGTDPLGWNDARRDAESEHRPSGLCSSGVDIGTKETNDGGMTRRARTGNALVAIAYLRVSTSAQELGPEAQRSSIEAWAAREGVSIVAWHVDAGVSGASAIEARPGLCLALADLRSHGAGALVVAKRDRVARDVVVAATIERAATAAGARLVSADGTANGDTAADAFMRVMLDGAAAYERGLIRARTKAALGVKKARGERVGTIAYGFRLAADGVRLEQDDAEQGVLSVVAELRASGLSQRAIVAELEVRGVVSRAGKPFGQTQIARLTRTA